MPETKLEPRTPRAEPAPQQPKSHGLALKDRRHLAVTGVSRVISCDENTAVLETPLGNLTIGGQELQIGELSTQSGQVQLSGKIEYLQYAENQQSGRRPAGPAVPLMAPAPAPWAVLGMPCGAWGWGACWPQCGMLCAWRWGKENSAAFCGMPPFSPQRRFSSVALRPGPAQADWPAGT